VTAAELLCCQQRRRRRWISYLVGAIRNNFYIFFPYLNIFFLFLNIYLFLILFYFCF
jgi:hypothetical protein